jgi:hypothetical protein
MALITIDAQKILGTIKQPRVWATVIMAVLLIAGVIWWYLAKEKRHRDTLLGVKRELLDTKYKLLACQNAPADTIYINRVIDLGPTPIIHPVPRRVMGPPVKDPSMVNTDTTEVPCPRNYYLDSLIFQQYSVQFEALGCLRNYRILKIKVNDKYPQITRHDVVIKYDTTFIPAPSPWFRAGPYVSLTLNSFTKFPGMELGAQVVVRDQFTVSIGGLYLDGIYGNIRVGILFKR